MASFMPVMLVYFLGSCSLSVKREIRHQSASLNLAVSMGLIACVNIAKHYTM